MQKQNPVIKNYILSSEKYVLKDENSKYRDNSMNICVKVEKKAVYIIEVKKEDQKD